MGPIRFALAMMVVLQHLVMLPFTGQYAVHVFFMLSGYLMTYVMQRHYGYTLAGWASYWQSRTLRLYPGYLISLAITACAFVFIGMDAVSRYQYNMGLPQSAAGWLQNLTMLYIDQSLFLDLPVVVKLMPQTWAIAIEIFFYMLISLGLSRTLWRVNLWLAFSIAFVIFWIATGHWDAKYSYFSLGAGSLPFALGSWLYFKRDRMVALMGRIRAWHGLSQPILQLLAGFALMAIIMWTQWGLIQFDYNYAGQIVFLLNMIPSLMIVTTISDKGLVIFSKPVDKLLGDLSYPIYISHWTAGVVAAYLLGIQESSLSLDGLMILALALPLMMAVSLAVVFCVDRPIERWSAGRKTRHTALRPERLLTDPA